MAKKNSRTLPVLAAVIVMALVVVAGAYMLMRWQNSRPLTPVNEVVVSATVDDSTVETTPYMMCEPGVECPEGNVPTITVQPDDMVTIEVPEDVYDHDWQLLTIYDDPGANDQQLHGPHDTHKVTIPVSAAPVGSSPDKPQLVVVEVSSVMIGTDDHGEETPYLTTWSFAFEQE